MVVRTQKAQLGFLDAFQRFEKIMEDEDVYQLVHFVAIFVGLGSLMISALDGNAESRGGPLTMIKSSLQNFIQSPLARGFLSPRVWFIGMALASYVLAHSEVLAQLARKSAFLELLRVS